MDDAAAEILVGLFEFVIHERETPCARSEFISFHFVGRVTNYRSGKERLPAEPNSAAHRRAQPARRGSTPKVDLRSDSAQ